MADPMQTKAIIGLFLLAMIYSVAARFISWKAFKLSRNIWKVHISGPDDIHGPFSEIEAYRFANDINKAWLKQTGVDRNTPLHVATVILAERSG